MIRVSKRAKRLIEALHEPFTNEERWQVAQQFLDEERDEVIKYAKDVFSIEQQNTEGLAKLARRSGLNPEAPNGVESSTLSPSAIPHYSLDIE